MRTLTVEGSLRALRSVHYLIHELFADPTMLATRSSKVSHLPEYSRTSSNKVSNREALFNDIAASPQGFTNGQTLPFGTLVTYGVLPETVRQLRYANSQCAHIFSH